MKFRTAMTFNSHKKDRSFFLHTMVVFLRETLTYDHRELITLIIEILKNIHDHTNGYGQIYINKTQDFVYFKIKDFGTKNYTSDIERFSQIGFTTKSNIVNRGCGLGLIARINSEEDKIGVNLKLDTSSGFKYTGKYNISVLGRE
ncbi:hypothetical protein KJ603_00105 [Patescibacteria group bacterium]|nr:hypothetical protein [Patescibacteria group bacterium]